MTQIKVLRVNNFFLQILVDILPDQRSQKLADPTDPDPMHCK